MGSRRYQTLQELLGRKVTVLPLPPYGEAWAALLQHMLCTCPMHSMTP
jgi:hypothetical protein